MDKVLILGARSFVGQGLPSCLEKMGYVVDTFSRGLKGRVGNAIYGEYCSIEHNQYFSEAYDAVINLAVLKDQSIEENVAYICSLIEMCKTHHVKRLIHLSSVMVYDYQERIVDERTIPERIDVTSKRGYGEIKIAVDAYLDSIRSTLPFELIFVRPGYVLADNRPCPFIINLPLGVHVIKGDKRSKQPIVLREDIHRALAAIIATEHNNPVYHFFPSDGMTKLRYAQQTVGGVVLTMPKWLFERIPYALAKLHLIPWSLYSRFQGMYIYSDFQSVQTEQKLQIHFNSLA